MHRQLRAIQRTATGKAGPLRAPLLTRRTFSAESSGGATATTSDDDSKLSSKSNPAERVIGAAKQHAFRAETKKLLDIVANSLYSDREVFCRELVSNAADALEKRRHLELTTGTGTAVTSTPLQINITLDKTARQFIIQDTGVGMTDAEMIELLGTIAKSGSKAFKEDPANDTASSSSSAKDNIIGQFGVGFYSAFMVGDRISVYSRSANEGSKGFCWESDGLGTYTLAEAEGVAVGTKIVIHLRENALDFAEKTKVEEILKRYSNFIGFPIKLNGETVNTVQPVWAMDKSSVTDEQYTDFYRFIGNAWDNYQFKLHFKTDAPVDIASLLFVPQRNPEQLGMGRMESGVNLYSRRVLIQAKASKLLPEYLRFVKGAISSEDIPMNLSREMLQNSHVLTKLSDIMTSKVIKWLQEEARKDATKFESFFNEFGTFLREGVCMAEPKHQRELAKLLRYESSALDAGKMTSLDDYLERKKAEQKDIYYLISSSRKWAEESPYFEQFKAKGVEVLFLYDPVDEFVVERLEEFKGIKLKSIDASGNDELLKSVEDKSVDGAPPKASFTDDERAKLVGWFKDTLGKSVSEVKTTESTHSFPAVIRDHESPTVRRMMKMVPRTSSVFLEEPPQRLEVNLAHPVLHGLHDAISAGNDALARDVTQQIFDNAKVAAGIMDDPRVMLKRINRLLAESLGVQGKTEVVSERLVKETVTKEESA